MGSIHREEIATQSEVPQFCGKGPMLVVKNTFIDEAPMPPSFERARTAPAYLKTRCIDDSSDEDESDRSTDGRDCLVQYAATNVAPPMEVFPTQQPLSMPYEDFWLRSNFDSSIPAYTMYPQEDAYSHMTLGQESLQFGSLQASTIVIAPTFQTNSTMNHGHAQLRSQLAPQPQTISVHPISGGYQIIWDVDARKLRTADKQAVSPAFELSLVEHFPAVTFKMIIYPSVKFEGKGGASFKNAQGKGRVTIKCEGDILGGQAPICFGIALGSCGVQSTKMQYGMHNFGQSAICSLSGSEAEWDLSSFVDRSSETFSVILNIMHAQ
jgi:hypothetical protein